MEIQILFFEINPKKSSHKWQSSFDETLAYAQVKQSRFESEKQVAQTG